MTQTSFPRPRPRPFWLPLAWAVFLVGGSALVGCGEDDSLQPKKVALRKISLVPPMVDRLSAKDCWSSSAWRLVEQPNVIVTRCGGADKNQVQWFLTTEKGALWGPRKSRKAILELLIDEPFMVVGPEDG